MADHRRGEELCQSWEQNLCAEGKNFIEGMQYPLSSGADRAVESGNQVLGIFGIIRNCLQQHEDLLAAQASIGLEMCLKPHEKANMGTSHCVNTNHQDQNLIPVVGDP